LLQKILYCVRACIVFIHLYSASHNTSLSEELLTTTIDTESEFTRRSATGHCKWRTCPKVPTWRLERELVL